MDQKDLVAGQMFWSNKITGGLSPQFSNVNLIFLHHEDVSKSVYKTAFFSYFYVPKFQIKLPLYPHEIEKLDSE